MKLIRPATRPINRPSFRPTSDRPAAYTTPSAIITRNWPRMNAPSTSSDSRASLVMVPTWLRGIIEATRSTSLSQSRRK
ncbi:hypothetical protein D3C71_1579340 [compost metagenome]